MKTNYDEILERLSLIDKVAQKLIKTNNIEKINNIKKELNIYKILIEEALVRKNQEVVIEENPEIKAIEDKVNILIRYKKLETTENNFLEGLGINRILFRLENAQILEDYNDNIREIVEILDSVAISFSEKDFTLTKDVNKYMKVLLKEFKNKNMDEYKQHMKNTFDGIYWENNDILEEVTLNLKKALKKIEPKIKDAMNRTRINYSKKYNITPENVDNQLLSLLKKERSLKETDKYLIDKKIKNNTINIHNFIGEDKQINKAINKFVNPSMYREMSIEQRNNFEDNVTKLYFNIKEYQIYKKYAFLSDEIRRILSDIQPKGFYEKQIKNYSKIIKNKEMLSNQLEKFEKEKNKYFQKRVFTLNGENSRLEKITDIDSKIKTLKKEIKAILKTLNNEQTNISRLKFEENVRTNLTESSSLFDILKIYSDNHIELMNSLKKNTNKTIKQLEESISELKRFISNPTINELKTIKLSDESFYEQKLIQEGQKFNLKIDFNNNQELTDVLYNAELIYEFKNLKRSRINLTELKKYI